jgi:hypothetical protein
MSDQSWYVPLLIGLGIVPVLGAVILMLVAYRRTDDNE